MSGVTAKGNRLIIRLTKPDGSFLTKLTMPFFQATSTTLPLTHAVTGAYPSAGPYRFTRNDPNVTSIRRNPYWKRGAGRMRPRHLAGLDVNWNQNEPRRDQFDEVSPPPAEVQGLAHKYGVNKTRFWVEPVNCVGWLLFNNREGLFRNNIPMRKAVNWAVDRRAYLSVAAPFTGSPWTNLLPPGIPGASRAQPFAGAPKMPRARRLARGHFRSGKVSIVYLSSGTVNPNQANSIRRDLIKLGFKPENVTLKGLSGSVIVFPPDRGWDIASSTGWCADYPDPYAFFLPLLSARYYEPWAPAIAEPRYRREIARAAQLIGNARLRAFARVETELMRNLAPVAPMRTYNNSYFFSNRVDPRSLSYQPVYSDWSIPELALK